VSPTGGIVVLGAGGHALVVLEALDALGWPVAGLLDQRRDAAPVLGRPVIGTPDLLPTLRAQGITAAVVAVGNNADRLALGQAALRAGLDLPALLHPGAHVSPKAEVAPGAQVMVRAVVGPLSVLGMLALVNTGAVVEHECIIGQATHVASGAVLCGGVRVGARVLIGAGARVAPGIHVGDGATVGLGAGVVRDVSAGTVVAGVPARHLRGSG
jgi:UDP-perosamine 4-acetyltransferase